MSAGDAQIVTASTHLSTATAVPNVAVIMSVYRNDSPERLAKALDSLIRQDGIDADRVRIYLAVDGPVSDAITQVIAAKRADIYKLLTFDTNRGLQFVLNDLIAVLEDEAFVFRMDADDVSHPERVVRQLEFLQEHPDIDIAGAGIREMHADGRIVCVPANNDVGPKGFYRRMPVTHPTVCYRRHVLDVIGGYPDVPFNEDVAMWIECHMRGYKFGNVDDYLLDFTIDDSFWKRRSYQRAFTEFRTHSRGIWKLEGVTWKYALPFMRMVFKLTPEWFRRWGYRSAILRNVSPDAP
jgi:glycosyltransferase involved in cell wall biosynthesis